jgi:hypothetical protein
LCPWGADGQRACGAAPPLLAGIMSRKRSARTARDGQRELVPPHGLAPSASFPQPPAPHVGQRAVDRAPAGQLRGPAPAPDVARVATGVDGTPPPLVGDAEKGARGGTRALSDETGARLTAADLGALPGTGNGAFTARFTPRGQAVRARDPQARHRVLAEGAAWDWHGLEAQDPAAVGRRACSQAAPPLAAAADLLFGAAPGPPKATWDERGRPVLREDLAGGAPGIRTLIDQRTRASLAAAAGQALETELQSCRRRAHKRP